MGRTVKTNNYLEVARRVIQGQTGSAREYPTGPATDKPITEPLEAALRGQAVELWSDSMGSLFLVADDADAQIVMERYGVQRGSIYTAGEIRHIISMNDPDVVAEIHNWKRTMNARISQYQKHRNV
jgi:hypothetical protein